MASAPFDVNASHMTKHHVYATNLMPAECFVCSMTVNTVTRVSFLMCIPANYILKGSRDDTGALIFVLRVQEKVDSVGETSSFIQLFCDLDDSPCVKTFNLTVVTAIFNTLAYTVFLFCFRKS